MKFALSQPLANRRYAGHRPTTVGGTTVGSRGSIADTLNMGSSARNGEALALAIAMLPSIQADSHGGGDHVHTALEDQMSAMNKAWRSIRRQIKDPAKNDSTLEYVAKVKKAAKKSVELTPILAKEKSGADKKN